MATKKPKVIKARSLDEVFGHPDEEIVVEPQFKVKLVRAETTKKPTEQPPLAIGAAGTLTSVFPEILGIRAPIDTSPRAEWWAEPRQIVPASSKLRI